MEELRWRSLRKGVNILKMFYVLVVADVVLFFMGLRGAVGLPRMAEHIKGWLIAGIIIALVEFALFWWGIIIVYINSRQLHIKWRVIGIICGWMPIVNLCVLFVLIKIAGEEARFELKKIKLNHKRHAQKVCATKYPILMVHGIFFRDFDHFNYWGRIPGELEHNGARIYYGEHESAASVQRCGEQLAEKIKKIVNETGCGKVNVIAHSKGGLDMRYALCHCDVAPFVASLTTINTPHRGCEFADYLLKKIPESRQKLIAGKYNRIFTKLGDKEADFIKGVTDLTASVCERFNQENKDVPGVLYQSVGSRLNHAEGGKFPLNFTYKLVDAFDGPNDGLVSTVSFSWGSSFELLTVKGKRGISHGDMIDLNGDNIKDFDVREFYVSLVSGLREKGL